MGYIPKLIPELFSEHRVSEFGCTSQKNCHYCSPFQLILSTSTSGLLSAFVERLIVFSTAPRWGVCQPAKL